MSAPVRTRVRGHGTGLLTTTIRSSPAGRHRWTRELGPLAPEPFPTGPRWLLDHLAAATDPACTARGAGGADRRTYAVPAPVSLAESLATRTPTAADAAAVRSAGRVLAQLHRRSPVLPAGTAVPTPRSLRRLGRLLAGRCPQPWAAVAGSALREHLGPARWQALRGWFTELADGPDRVLVHGGAGLGAISAAPDGRSVLVVGEDVGLAAPQLDTGWVLGEITELAWRSGREPSSWSALASALAEGAGRRLDGRDDAAACLRVVLHLHDYHAYVRWDADECRRTCVLVGRMVDAALRAGDPR